MAGRPIVDNVEKGYNASVFAYGQTGAGKTFTMTGKLTRDNELVRPCWASWRPETAPRRQPELLTSGLSRLCWLSWFVHRCLLGVFSCLRAPAERPGPAHHGAALPAAAGDS